MSGGRRVASAVTGGRRGRRWYRRRLVKVLLLVNSSASSVTARGRVVIQKALSADHEVTLAETSRRGHATRLAQGAANEGTEVVVVLGGDGTLNEAANGLAGTACALAALPGGSTNVFARTIGLPNDPIEATGVLLDALGRRSIERVGLGSVNGRYFLFHVGLGFDAATVQQVERRSTFKRYLGHPLFAYSAVTAWLRYYEHSEPRFDIEHETPGGGTESVGSAFTVVLNTNPYTYLGNIPFDVAPEATLERGLVVLSVKKMTLVTILRLVGTALAKGGRPVSQLPFLDYRTDVTGCTAIGRGPFPYQVDGDHLGDTEELVFRHVPDILDVVLPA